MGSANTAIAASQRIKQKRGQKTYDALIDTAFELLEEREFDDISIADLAQKAGYSVGAFYARFKSKNELFDALVTRHIEQRTTTRERQFATAPDDTLVREVVQGLVDYFWGRRRFWRAALFRSIRDPDFWKPLRKLSHEARGLLRREDELAGEPRSDRARGNQRALRGAGHSRNHQQHDDQSARPDLHGPGAVRGKPHSGVSARVGLRRRRRSAAHSHTGEEARRAERCMYGLLMNVALRNTRLAQLPSLFAVPSVGACARSAS